MFKILFDKDALKHISYWEERDPKKALKIKGLVASIAHDPTKGIGKPERLKGIDGNIWSRRIDQEHRLIYKINGNEVLIKTAKYHY